VLLKASAWLLGLGPLVWTGIRFGTDRLGANPVEALLHWAGRWALVLLLVGLAITPIRRFTGWNQVIKVRRLVGLFAFFYTCLHLIIYLGLDQGFAWSFIIEDVLERPFITSGVMAFLLLVPLAATSTKGWIRRLGKRWQRLHRLVYPAAGLGVLHFYWKVKLDTFWPLVAAAILFVLMVARIPWKRFYSSASFMANKKGRVGGL
jgi:sulfoxide reductase heme-binding subunit YedZ